MTKYAARSLTLDIGASPIGQLTSIAPVGSTRDLIDASAYGDDWKDYVLGQQDGDEMACVAAADLTDAGQWAVEQAYLAGTPTSFTLTHADSGDSFSFDALVTNRSFGGDLGGLYAMNFTLKVVNPGVSVAS